MSLSCKDISDSETSKYEIEVIRYLENTRRVDKFQQIRFYSEFYNYNSNVVLNDRKKERALTNAYERVFADFNLYFENLVEYFDLRKSFYYLLRRITSSSSNVSVRFTVLEKTMFIIDTNYVRYNKEAFNRIYADAYFSGNDYTKYQFWKIIDSYDVSSCDILKKHDTYIKSNVHKNFLSALFDQYTDPPSEITDYVNFYAASFDRYKKHAICDDQKIFTSEKSFHCARFTKWTEKISDHPDVKAYNIIIRLNEEKPEISDNEKIIVSDYLERQGLSPGGEINKKFEEIEEYAKVIFIDHYEYFLMNFFFISAKLIKNNDIVKFFVSNLVDMKSSKKYLFYYDHDLFFKKINIDEFTDCLKIVLLSKISDIFENSYNVHEDIMKIRETIIEVVYFIGPSLKSLEISDIKRTIDRYAYEKKDCYQTTTLPNINSPLAGTTFMVDNKMINIPNSGLRKYLNTLRDEKMKKPHVLYEFNFYASKCVLEINYPSGKIEAGMNFIDAFVLIIIDKHRNLDFDQLLDELAIDKKVLVSSIARLGKMIRENKKIFEMNPDYNGDKNFVQLSYKSKKTKTVDKKITEMMFISMKTNALKIIKKSGKIKKTDLFKLHDFECSANFDKVVNSLVETEYIEIKNDEITYLV